MAQDTGDKRSVLFQGLNGFWHRFFKDTPDLEAYYTAAEVYLGQVYLDLMASVLNTGIVDTPVFNKEYWKLFTIKETDLNYREGALAEDNRFIYDPPGDVVDVEFLQNTIFEPTVVLEKDVDFDIRNNDGLLRFHADLFRGVQEDDGTWSPYPGVAWRSVTRQVGNNFTDRYRDLYPDGSYYDLGVRRGDSLRIIGTHLPTVLNSGSAGSVVAGVSEVRFQGVNVGLAPEGSIVEVYGHAGSPGDFNDQFVQYYVVKEYVSDNEVILELNTLGILGNSSTLNLYWRTFAANYQVVRASSPYVDYEVDLIKGMDCLGVADTPFPLVEDARYIYSIVRDVPGYESRGFQLNNPQVTSVDGESNIGKLGTVSTTSLGVRHVKPGTLKIGARVQRLAKSDPDYAGLEALVEGVDFSVDYTRGIITQLTYWVPDVYTTPQVIRCDFEFSKEVLFSAGGRVEEVSAYPVRELSFWVPEVQVDRFTLYYNYGALLNRFEASSEAYKTFLRGIMYLYMSGPILERIEAALNIAAGYPVNVTDGEVLTGYDDGIWAQGTAGVLNSSAETLTVDTGVYVFSEDDEGSLVRFDDPLSDKNKGAFRVIGVDTVTNSVLLETPYGFITEDPITWKLMRDGRQTITTNLRSYEYPYTVPIREDIQDESNVNALSFKAFEPLTTAFTVVDYLEDPSWWHDKVVPDSLWRDLTSGGTSSRKRRTLSTRLYAHIVGAEDGACVGDPGLYVGADNYGNPLETTVIDGVEYPAFRQSTAFFIFDQFMKMHMFYVKIARGLGLTAEFRADLEELILVAKPSYMYPYVDPGELFIDDIVVTDLLTLSGINFVLGTETQDRLDSLHMADNALYVGEANFPYAVGDFFRYTDQGPTGVAGLSDPPLTGESFVVPGVPTDAGILVLNIQATVGGEPVLEGRDYTVQWLRSSVNAWEVTLLTDWDAGAVTVTYRVAERSNAVYDTRDGWTPLIVGGINPWYIRREALDPDAPDYEDQWAATRTEFIDRPIQLTIDDDGNSYTY